MKKSQYEKQTGMSMIAILVGVAAIIGAAWLFIASQGSQQIEVPTTSSPNQAEYLKTESELEAESNGGIGAVEAARNAVEATEAATAERTQGIAVGEYNPATPGAYIKYDEAALTAGTNIIFFHATWCPTCRALEKNITNNVTDIPNGVTILKADYDSQTALKQKYGVVRQHTLVVVDQNGNEIKTLTGLTNTLEQVLQQL